MRLPTRRALGRSFGRVPCVLERRLELEQRSFGDRRTRGRRRDPGVRGGGEPPSPRHPRRRHRAGGDRAGARARSPAHRRHARRAASATRACSASSSLSSTGRLLVNEIAPRPHNSGHYTMDACATSQYEQQVRALVPPAARRRAPAQPRDDGQRARRRMARRRAALGCAARGAARQAATSTASASRGRAARWRTSRCSTASATRRSPRRLSCARSWESGMTDIARAAAILRAGGLVAFPTETVYGLGADASNPAAVARLYKVERPSCGASGHRALRFHGTRTRLGARCSKGGARFSQSAFGPVRSP